MRESTESESTGEVNAREKTEGALLGRNTNKSAPAKSHYS